MNYQAANGAPTHIRPWLVFCFTVNIRYANAT